MIALNTTANVLPANASLPVDISYIHRAERENIATPIQRLAPSLLR